MRNGFHHKTHDIFSRAPNMSVNQTRHEEDDVESQQNGGFDGRDNSQDMNRR